MGTMRIENKIEDLAIAEDTKVLIPSDGLSEFTAYEISLYVNGDNPVYLIHADAAGQVSGHRIPPGGVATLGPIDTKDFPAIYAEAGAASNVVVSYANSPE